jgi:plastocyanin
MPNRTLLRALLAVALMSLIGLTACGPKTATLTAQLKDFAYVPNEWSVPAGAKVTINLNNTGTQEHNWILMKLGTQASPPFNTDDEPNILQRFKVESGQTATFNFDAPTAPGDYEVVCGTPAHLEQGMKGTLTVTP